MLLFNYENYWLVTWEISCFTKLSWLFCMLFVGLNRINKTWGNSRIIINDLKYIYIYFNKQSIFMYINYIPVVCLCMQLRNVFCLMSLLSLGDIPLPWPSTRVDILYNIHVDGWTVLLLSRFQLAFRLTSHGKVIAIEPQTPSCNNTLEFCMYVTPDFKINKDFNHKLYV